LTSHSKQNKISTPISSVAAELPQEVEQPLELDMEELSKELSEEPEPANEEDDLEFLLAVDDLQSALAFNATDDRTYSLKAPKRHRGSESLSTMYDDREMEICHEEGKRLSTPEMSPEKLEKADMYDQEELINFLTKDYQLTINRDPKSNRINVDKKPIQKTKDHFFEGLSNSLRDLAKEYSKEMDEMHMLFMEVSCDLGELRSLLKGQKAPKWSMLEDLAIQSEPDSMEFKHICDMKGSNHVHKRRKFLELQI
jgi:hypothetical protein